jgi:hypothetical protein
VSDLDQQLSDAITRAAEAHRPPPGWQVRVRAQAMRPRSAPLFLIITSVTGFLAVAGLVGFMLVQSTQHRREQTRAAVRERVLLEEQARLAGEMDRVLGVIDTIDKENNALLASLDEAQNDADRKLIKDRISANVARSRVEKSRMKQLQDAKRAKATKMAACKDPNDALCGL